MGIIMTSELLHWLRPEYRGREDELIHLAGAARIAGVTRACVSNWNRRHASFRKLVAARTRDGGPAASVYLPEAEFRAWLDDRTRRTEPVVGGARPTGIEGKRLAAEKAKNHRGSIESRLAKAEEQVRTLRKQLKHARALEDTRAQAFQEELQAARRLLEEADATG
ncbi:hypothetical protein ACIBBE_24595 [Streptomyces sp. NPDC051644]|uniref:hypothetical protein n=1 Tax=Streptomyces sp. NPDC051644 TaxID=3365666 RepID=UPI0037A0EA24